MMKTPEYYNPERIGTLFYPEFQQIAEQATHVRKQEATKEAPQVNLLLIDMQVDFCHENGSLYVPGAENDIQRTIEFIFQHSEHISRIACSLDTHLPHQIFHSTWWDDQSESPPSPLTVIEQEEVDQKWSPRFHPKWSEQYVEKLENQEQKKLTIWPFHVLQGGVGNILDQELYSAVFWHSVLKDVNPEWLVKGTEPRSEHYSVMAPEIQPEDETINETRSRIHELLTEEEALIIAGEAKSHCVLETLQDLVDYYSNQNPELLNNIYVLEDCTSPVQHPEIDFAEIASEAFEAFSRAGINIVDSKTLDLESVT